MEPTPNRALRGLASPLRRFFDARFRSVHEHVDVNLEQHLRPFLDRRLDAVETRIGWVDDRLFELKAELGAKLDRYEELERRISTDAQTAAEFAATSRRLTEGLAADLAAVRSAVEQADGALSGQVGVPLEELSTGGADLLNWAASHRGPAAQGGLWFNPPVSVELVAGGARPGTVNERIVEVPYALAAVAALPPGAAVLDFGAAESTLALSLASLGFAVTALDLRPPPVAHPRLTPVVGPVEDWPGPEQPLDAILSVSTLEHVGLGAYGGGPLGDDLDRRVVERFATWLRPGGQLVLTAPYGAWEVGEEERVYDRDHLDALLAGWEVLDRRVCVQSAPDRWEAAEGEPPSWMWDGGTRGVVLLRATPAG